MSLVATQVPLGTMWTVECNFLVCTNSKYVQGSNGIRAHHNISHLSAAQFLTVGDGTKRCSTCNLQYKTEKWRFAYMSTVYPTSILASYVCTECCCMWSAHITVAMKCLFEKMWRTEFCQSLPVVIKYQWLEVCCALMRMYFTYTST